MGRFGLVGLACVAALASACADSDGAPVAPAGQTATTVGERSGPGMGRVRLETPEVALGDPVRVRAEGWEGGTLLEFYLLSEEQAQDLAASVARYSAPKIGETRLDERGAATFEFELARRFETEIGGALAVEAGQRYVVAALERTDGGVVTQTEPFTAR